MRLEEVLEGTGINIEALEHLPKIYYLSCCPPNEKFENLTAALQSAQKGKLKNITIVTNRELVALGFTRLPIVEQYLVAASLYRELMNNGSEEPLVVEDQGRCRIVTLVSKTEEEITLHVS